MTKNGLLSPKEALEALGLYNPALHKKPWVRQLTDLNKRGLLNRIKAGKKTFLYKKVDCDLLLKKAETEGLNLKQRVK
jgi:hypothetical protein